MPVVTITNNKIKKIEFPDILFKFDFRQQTQLLKKTIKFMLVMANYQNIRALLKYYKMIKIWLYSVQFYLKLCHI